MEKMGKGLENTVSEMLQNYEPASMHKKPFWCRVCRFQGTSMEDFIDHNATVMHKKASDIERKMSMCKLCKKQFTSPEQLKEHLSGKAHSQMLQKYRNKNKSAFG